MIPLIKIMNDEKCNVRYGSALSLSMVGDERAISMLEKATNDENPVVRKVAKIAIKEIQNRLE